ncbi:hypothetical protein HPP92_027134 [Vanilla planifolia]|uniref:Large ribosomal subunit protein bL12 C-terminal domain-containing protein n=1 Tax=Vanilla planifolia TaxID=51239 RepID=A0A835U6S0_VANPL|nr:hypothetical protein HPP92_027134 [Vanilla planifolia]
MTSILRTGRQILSRCPSSSICIFRFYSLSSRTVDIGEELEMFDQRMLPTDYDPAKFDPTEHRSPPSERVWRLVDEVSALTLAETHIAEPPVIGIMKPGASLFGIGAGLAGASASVAEEQKVPEKTVFDLKLESYDAASKIKVIKEVRAFTDLGLKEAKELVEKTPTVIKGGLSKEEAEQIIEKLKAAGAKKEEKPSEALKANGCTCK